MFNIEEFAKTGELFDGRYKLLRPLSTDGGTADVWLAIDANTIDAPTYTDDDAESPESASTVSQDDTGIMVAIKVYRPKNALDIEGEQRFRDEYKIVFNCHHTNLLQPTNFSIFKDIPYLVLPYCSQGSSESLIGKEHHTDDLWKYVFDVSSGLAYLHALTPPIIHQDIKPANVLIDDNGNYTITDFGISTKFGGHRHGYDYDEGASGTLAYMAPERFIEGHKPMAESDIWAFGATLYEIITGDVPYGEGGGEEQSDGPVHLFFPPYVPNDIRRLVRACMAKRPQRRPTAEQLIAIAQARKYPSRARKALLRSLIPIGVIVLGVLVWFLTMKPRESTPAALQEPTKSAKEIYDEAMTLIHSDEPDSIKSGLTLMNSLSDSTYIPALYELAYTYGCYSDSVSLNRKRLLGIEVGNKNVDKRALNNMAPYLPKDDEYNNQAMDYFRRIVESPGESYKETKMNSAYRLGVYYLFYTRNVALSQKYLKMCHQWAKELADDTMLQMVSIALDEAR